MRIVEQSVELEHITPDAMKVIERAGRTCYKSEEKITGDSADKFVDGIIKRNHLSVLEHCSASFRVICDRGISHEIVRHRAGCSYSQESSRYCSYDGNRFGNEISVIEPDFKGDKFAWSIWHQSCMKSEIDYFKLLEDGVPPQTARSVLPTCLKTEIVMTANFRAWLHFLELREPPAAHPQIREISVIKAMQFISQSDSILLLTIDNLCVSLDTKSTLPLLALI